MLQLRSTEASVLCGNDVKGMAAAIEKIAARNRVCHTRPLEESDLPEFIDLADLLLSKYPKVDWKTLKSVRGKIADPSFVFRLTIPAYWGTDPRALITICQFRISMTLVSLVE